MDSNTILFAKWVGAIGSVRWLWVWLGVICAIGLATTGLNPLAVPCLAAAWMAYAGVVAMVGLWFSMNCKTTLRATVWTILAVLGLTVGHWLITALGCLLPLSVMGEPPDFVRQLAKIEAGLTPPFALGWLAFNENGLPGTDSPRGYHNGEEF